MEWYLDPWPIVVVPAGMNMLEKPGMDRSHLGPRRTENQGIADTLMGEMEARSLGHIQKNAWVMSKCKDN